MLQDLSGLPAASGPRYAPAEAGAGSGGGVATASSTATPADGRGAGTAGSGERAELATDPGDDDLAEQLSAWFGGSSSEGAASGDDSSMSRGMHRRERPSPGSGSGAAGESIAEESELEGEGGGFEAEVQGSEQYTKVRCCAKTARGTGLSWLWPILLAGRLESLEACRKLGVGGHGAFGMSRALE